LSIFVGTILRYLRLLIITAALLLLLSLPSEAEQRFALLIGNQKYDTGVGAPLTHPHEDIKNVGDALELLGFKVTPLEDGGYKEMMTAMSRYLEEVSKAGPDAISFFYYSGHGAASPDHINYLIPVDVKSISDSSLWANSIKQVDIIRKLKEDAPEATHFVILDACRNELNLPKAAGKAVGGDKGFVGIPQRVGMLIAYATPENETAADSGVFAKILAEELLRPGIEVGQVFRNVQVSVDRHMGQMPFVSSGGIRETYFTATPAGSSSPCNSVSLVADGRTICRMPRDGQQFKDCSACPEMVLVPPGDVTLYGPLGILSGIRQIFTWSDLRPVYKIHFADAIAVSRFPITFDEWDACVAAGGCKQYQPADGGWGRYGYPVTNVSWSDAMNYIAWLKSRTGHEYRLLSEAEREYLKRKDDVSADCSNCDQVVTQYVQTMEYDSKGGAHQQNKPILVAKTRIKTLPVRKFVPNEWGLYGIRGNVDEWVADCWNAVTFEVIPNDGNPWKEENCKSHTIVGVKARESFFAPYIEIRWAAKIGDRDLFTSFRVARTIKP
jgi:formylglycine-generating enzyme required for sulfatase activity